MAKLIPPPEPLSDGVVSLRPWRLADAPAVAAACQDPDIQHWTRVPSPYADADACEWLENQPQRWQTGASAEFAVVAASSGELLGCTGLVDIEWDDRRAEIGYWVVAGARRRGVARRAVLLLCDWVFGELDLVRLEILTTEENQASCGVALTSGFSAEGVRRRYCVTKTGSCDFMSFSRLCDDPAVTPR